MALHDGHRERMRQEFLQGGLDSFSEVRTLELLLFFSRPQGDVNPLAHALLDTFGSLAGVLDASPEDLARVPGVGKNTVVLLKLFPALSAKYLASRARKTLDGSTLEGLREIFMPCFFGARNEMTYLACFDNSFKLLGVRKLSEGGPSASDISLRKLVSTALSFNADLVVLAHNHPNGDASPSDRDLSTTKQLRQYLQPLELRLHDHVILTDEKIISLQRYLRIADIPRY
ncbi:MAG: RadC family protein [Ruminiclostridium sp.]|jgi:DNA repair protein RadC|nr:RadC family protein [Ruminiclostridium sp.]